MIPCAFIESLRVPTGPKTGELIALAPFQKRFLRGALARGITTAVLSVARGAGKSTITGGIGLGHLVGEIDPQPAREVLVAARNRDQARIVYEYVVALAQSLPDEVRARLTFRRHPRLEIEYEDEDGGTHFLRCIPADGRSSLGTSPTLVICDERAHWLPGRGDDLELALRSGIGKRGGRMILISTSADSDAHPFSRWLDEPPDERTYVQQHMADAGCAPDDLEQIKKANPGSEHGIGASLEWLQAEAQRAIAQGGAALTSFRLYNLNQRVSGEVRDVLLTVDQWQACEVADLPPRHGPCVVGIDLGGSSSMSAACYFWPQTGRLESHGWFPSTPNLLDRGQADSVARRYVEMHERGELSTLGAQTVPVKPWLLEVLKHVDGEHVQSIVADRFKSAELGEALVAAGIRAPIIWRGMGFKDGGEDSERFRRACLDGVVKSSSSLLLRSAIADTVCLRDPANNIKLAKARSRGRIDAACAAVLAVAQGARVIATPKRTGRLIWA